MNFPEIKQKLGFGFMRLPMIEENVDEQSIDKQKNNKILKIILLVCGAIIIGCFITGYVLEKNAWYSSVNENKMIELAKDKIEERFSSAANLSYRYGDIEYKEEDFNSLYYFMFYTVTVTVTNQFGAQTKYFCTVKIYFNKETMEYTVNKPSCNKLLE